MLQDFVIDAIVDDFVDAIAVLRVAYARATDIYGDSLYFIHILNIKFTSYIF